MEREGLRSPDRSVHHRSDDLGPRARTSKKALIEGCHTRSFEDAPAYRAPEGQIGRARASGRPDDISPPQELSCTPAAYYQLAQQQAVADEQGGVSSPRWLPPWAARRALEHGGRGHHSFASGGEAVRV